VREKKCLPASCISRLTLNLWLCAPAHVPCYGSTMPQLRSVGSASCCLISKKEGTTRLDILTQLLGSFGENLWIEPPFYCDYGKHIRLGKNCYMNFNCCILDCAAVELGDNVFFGPSVQVGVVCGWVSLTYRNTHADLRSYPSCCRVRAAKGSRACSSNMHRL